jgi:hypothetical protein
MNKDQNFVPPLPATIRSLGLKGVKEADKKSPMEKGHKLASYNYLLEMRGAYVVKRTSLLPLIEYSQSNPVRVISCLDAGA